MTDRPGENGTNGPPFTAADEGVQTVDKRRFDASGERIGRADEDAAPAEAAAEPSIEDAPGLEAVPDVVPADEARMWETRARAAEGKLIAVSDDFRRARAETEAVRQRLERDRETRVRDALGRAFAKILTALDNLDRALEHAGDDPVADGVRLVHKQLLEALAAEGLERITVLGEVFDPNVAEAVATVPAESPEMARCVVDELRAGYRLGDRIVRPAQVRVAM
jgi:molecular chaperone GrpE